MKNQKLIAVTILVILGFASCKKEEEQLIVSTPQSAQRNGAAILPVFDCYPTAIRSAHGTIEQQFTYNAQMQLATMFNEGEGFSTFEYGATGKLQRINYYADQNDRAGNLTSYDLLFYPNNNAKAPSKIQRFELPRPIPVSAERANTNATIGVRPTSFIEIAYDRSGNKVAETEYPNIDKGIPTEQRYTYDGKGNVTSVTLFRGGIKINSILFDGFDANKNIYINVGALKLIPFHFTGTNNVTRILGNTGNSKTAGKAALINTNIAANTNCGNEVFKKYSYNSSGFPSTVTTITFDGDYTQKIDYTIPSTR